MSFTPKYGPTSTEDFSSPEGLTLDTYQTVNGGYLALKTIATGSRNYFTRWAQIDAWSFVNNLNSVLEITGDFTRLSGVVIAGATTPAYLTNSDPYGYSGFQRNIAVAGPYVFNTIEPAISPVYGGYTGQVTQSIVLDKDCPNPQWYGEFTSGAKEVTIEFDIMSLDDIYTGNVSIGFNEGEELLDALPGLSGQLVNHGIYIDNGAYWDYLEVNPFGIRSINHPQFGIPIDLTSPKRIRLGITNQNLILTTEGGQGVFGVGILDTPVVLLDDAKIAFGAPPVTGDGARFLLLPRDISGVVGTSYWDSIKILHGASYVTSLTGNFLYYTPSAQTGYTDVYEPGSPINNWNIATVGYFPYNNASSTTVTAQYSGVGGWTDGPSVTLNDLTSRTEVIDLQTIPVFHNSRNASTHGRIYNPLRFKIVQQSDGTTPPPAVDYISFSVSSEKAYLDIVPNWKPTTAPGIVELAIKNREFDDLVANPTKFSTYVLNAPLTTGVYTTDSVITQEDSIFTRPVKASGLIDVIYNGFNTTSIKTFTYSGVSGTVGSDAYNLLGPGILSNCFRNVDLDLPFINVENDLRFFRDRTDGEIATDLYIPDTYTGRSLIKYSKKEVFRPILSADRSRTASFSDQDSSTVFSSVQNVYIPSQDKLDPGLTSNYHDESAGIEIEIPSGISSGLFLFSADVQVVQGTGLYIYATGEHTVYTTGTYVNAAYYRDFRPLSLAVNCIPTSQTGRVRIGIVAPPWSPGEQSVEFNIDNISYRPINTGFVYSTGVVSILHQEGLLREKYTGQSIEVAPYRAGTVFSIDVNLAAYPTAPSGIIFSKRQDSDSRGFTLYCTNQGKIGIDLDTEAQSWANDSSATAPYIGGHLFTTLVSDYTLPLNTWTTLSFVHQSDCFKKLGYVSYSGALFPTNFASTSRLYLLADGSPIAVTDLMKNWNIVNFTLNEDGAPYLSYIVDGSGVATVGSGLLMDFDAVTLEKPPVADAEIDVSIRKAKVAKPYFVPEVYCKPTAEGPIKNFLIADDADIIIGNDYFLGSIYNFDSPGFTNWDHGPWRNHLLFYGDVKKLELSPYDPSGIYGLGSTYFSGSSYAVAKYSSTTERQFNSISNLGINTLTAAAGSNYNAIKVLGWVYPFTSGTNIFEMFENINNLDGKRLQFRFTDDMYLAVQLKDGSNTLWGVTGNIQHPVTEWSWVGFGAFLKSTHDGNNNVVIISNSGMDGFVLAAYPEANKGFHYLGRSGLTGESCFMFGRNSNIALADFAVSSPYSADLTIYDPNMYFKNCYGDKSGRYNVVMKNDSIYTGYYATSGFNFLYVNLPKEKAPKEEMLWVAGHNSYDNSTRLNGGIHLFDDEPFRHTASYYLEYDDSPIKNLVGSQISPIRIGNQVPAEAINLAKISAPSFNAANSVAVLDLADYNSDNLLSYRNGEYTIAFNEDSSTSGYTSTGSFSQINYEMFTGKTNVTFSSQSYSSEIDVSPIIISSPNSPKGYPGYYYYLVGRGSYGVSVNNANPHNPTGLLFATTGELINSYIENIQKIKSNISVRDSQGRVLGFDEYPYEVVISPYTPEYLTTAIQSGISINLEGIYRSLAGTGFFEQRLPDGVFSVILVTNKDSIASNSSAWVHYPAYDVNVAGDIIAKKEVINPAPIMRKNLAGEIPLPGRFEISLNPSSYLFDVKIIGVDNDYANKF